jgi:SAM-dependent methyltransferase
VPGRNGIVDDDCSFLAALASQCFTSEYCYVIDPGETTRLQALETVLTRTLADEDWKAHCDPARFCVYGMYRPLHRLPGCERLLEHNDLLHGAAIGSLLDLQLRGPREECEIRTHIPAITAIDDSVSCRVREMYEASPYPPWLTVARREALPFEQQMKQMFPLAIPPALDGGRVEMLVAGCGTGKQAIMSATRFDRARVLAVDLSLSSLAYAVRKTRQLGIDNITFAQADILQLAALPQRFHMIESVGVLHHMHDPQRGLEVLAGLLHDNGLMNIGLYSEFARRHIATLQAHFRQSGLHSSTDDIRRARAAIIAGDSEAGRRVMRIADFYSISGCRDLLFHVQERRFRLSELTGMLARAGLRFLGFGWSDSRVPDRYRQENPEDPLMTDLARWDIYERRHPDTFLGMYQFWCQKV